MNYRPRRNPEGSALRPLPSVIDIERQLLTATILDPSILAELLPHLDPSIFYAPSSVELAKAIIRLHSAGNPVDIATISQELPNIPSSELIAWAENSLPSQWQSYLDIVKKTAFARSLLTIIDKARERIYAKAVD